MDRRGVDGGARADHNRQSFCSVLPCWSQPGRCRFTSPGPGSPERTAAQEPRPGSMARRRPPIHFSVCGAPAPRHLVCFAASLAAAPAFAKCERPGWKSHRLFTFPKTGLAPQITNGAGPVARYEDTIAAGHGTNPKERIILAKRRTDPVVVGTCTLHYAERRFSRARASRRHRMRTQSKRRSPTRAETRRAPPSGEAY
jgi:hypothetical protein